MPNGNTKLFSDPHIQFRYVYDGPWSPEIPKFTRKLFGLPDSEFQKCDGSQFGRNKAPQTNGVSVQTCYAPGFSDPNKYR